MTGVRIGIIASLLLCVWLAWPKGGTPPRPLLIKSALKQADDAVIFLGDSIVRQAELPRTICKRPVVNAGIDGSMTSSGLDAMLKKAIGDKKAAMIVVSLGINDAETLTSVETYRSNYTKLLDTLKPLTSRIALARITALESGKPEIGHRSQQLIDSYNAALPGIAGLSGATVITIPPMPAAHTTDGVHLSAAGYEVWTGALRSGIEAALCPGA